MATQPLPAMSSQGVTSVVQCRALPPPTSTPTASSTQSSLPPRTPTLMPLDWHAPPTQPDQQAPPSPLPSALDNPVRTTLPPQSPPASAVPQVADMDLEALFGSPSPHSRQRSPDTANADIDRLGMDPNAANESELPYLAAPARTGSPSAIWGHRSRVPAKGRSQAATGPLTAEQKRAAGLHPFRQPTTLQHLRPGDPGYVAGRTATEVEPARIIAWVDLDALAAEAAQRRKGRRTRVPINQFGHIVDDVDVFLAEANELANLEQMRHQVVALPLDDPMVTQSQASIARQQETDRTARLATLARADREAAKEERHRAAAMMGSARIMVDRIRRKEEARQWRESSQVAQQEASTGHRGVGGSQGPPRTGRSSNSNASSSLRSLSTPPPSAPSGFPPPTPLTSSPH